MSEPTPLLVLGTTRFAVEIADVAAQTGRYRVAGFVENQERERCSEALEGLPVHWIDDLGELVSTHLGVCGLGTTRRSLFTDQAAAHGLRFATVVHPSAQLSPISRLGEGTVVGAGVVVAAHTEIGRHVLLNRGALIGHHTIIGDYVSVQSGANVAGSCRVGEATYIGMGALVLDHLEIGSRAVVGAGAVVTKSVSDNVLVTGVPARVVKENADSL
jgi:acetyltransferase EpsM